MVRGDGTSVSVWKPVPYPILADESAEPDMADQPDDHAESSSLKKRKKTIVTGVWPCKINGCTKQFAREADLKRHQRTTKQHSMPSFQCPQCDANFTRADALRRHQKSRHGVVKEAVEANKDDNESRSRSGTPSSLKGKEKATNLPVQTYQGAPTSTGPSSYYRSHTATTTPYIPSRPTQLGLPTSSVRAGPPWPEYPQAWQNGQLPPNVGTIGYTMSMYYPSPHYRPHTNGYHTGRSPPPQPPPPPLYQSTEVSPSSTSRNTSSQPPNSSSISESSIACIDSELEGGSELTAADVVAAVQAVLLQAETEEKAKKQREKEEKERLLREQGQEGNGIGATGDDESMDLDRSMEDGLGALHGYEPMEHILTEDGEPMLNPAELLTQESLAESPPP